MADKIITSRSLTSALKSFLNNLYNWVPMKWKKVNIDTLQVWDTNEDGEVAFGKYNRSTADMLFSVGDGKSDDTRSNAFDVRSNGDINIKIDGEQVVLQEHLEDIESQLPEPIDIEDIKKLN